jgi:TonB family protein
MSPIENDQLKNVRNPGRPDSEAGIVRPMRVPNELFGGWGPKLMAATLIIGALAFADKPAFATEPFCGIPDHAAVLLHGPAALTPEGVGASGETLVRVDLRDTGRVSSVSVARSSGNFDLDTAALRIAEQSTYAPASVDCRPTADSVLYGVTFTNE